MRWRIIQALNIGRPAPLSEDTLMQCVSGGDMPLQPHDLRVELDYLETRKLIEISGRGTQPQWDSRLTRYGMDLAEYAIECESGIARPPKYW